MAYEFKLPDIGEGVVEGEIVRWLISGGDELLQDQPMVEVMTDKATVEIHRPVIAWLWSPSGLISVSGKFLATFFVPWPITGSDAAIENCDYLR